MEEIVLLRNKSCLGEIHFACNVLHPLVVTRFSDKADGCGVARKRCISENVGLKEGKAHGYFLFILALLRGIGSTNLAHGLAK